MESSAYSIAELSRPHTPFSRSMLYEQIKTRRLIARKVGRKTVVLARDYQAWLNSLPAAVAETKGQASTTGAERSSPSCTNV